MNLIQQIAIELLKANAGNNPILSNVLQMTEKGDMQGVEDIAKNFCREKGINPEQAIMEIKNNLDNLLRYYFSRK